jgi:hypothetical protein
MGGGVAAGFDAVASGLEAVQATEGSSRKPWKMPMALEPPPTQAQTASGSFPACSRICARASLADHLVEVPDHGRERCAAGRGTQR